MSCEANPAHKEIKFIPMPMAALIANLKTQPTTVNGRDSSNCSEDSSSSFDVSLDEIKPKTSSDLKNRVLLAENRSAVKSVVNEKLEQTPIQVQYRLRNKENVTGSRKEYRFPGVDVLPTIEASTSLPVSVDSLRSALKYTPLVEKKEGARCLFPEPGKDSPPKAAPTPREIPVFRAILHPPPEEVNQAQATQLPTQPTLLQPTPIKQQRQPQQTQATQLPTQPTLLQPTPIKQQRQPQQTQATQLPTQPTLLQPTPIKQQTQPQQTQATQLPTQPTLLQPTPIKQQTQAQQTQATQLPTQPTQIQPTPIKQQTQPQQTQATQLPTQPTQIQPTPIKQQTQPQQTQQNQVTQPTPMITVTPSQPAGPKNMVGIRYKTINIKGKKYMVIKTLGTGGSSEVFKVLEFSTRSEFAVKRVDLATDREMAQGYLNEVLLLRDLQKSDRVIKLYEYEYDRPNHELRLVMEVGETDLAHFMRAHRDGAPPALVLHYWEEMLRAVKQIHDHGIVHADLKPANFLLVSGRLKLIDFGIASAVSGDATSVVRSCGKGTFSYISPEALGGEGSQPFKVSFYSDVWSLGCILYSLVYGHTPFSHLATLAKLVTIKDPGHTIEYPPVDCIPPSLITALQSCLRYDAHSRPTVTQLLEMRHLQYSTRSLPDTLLAKLRHAVSPEEFTLLQRAKVYEE